MNFGHLKDNKLIPARQPITIDDRDYFTSDPELMLQAGEKEIVTIERPVNENINKGRYVLSYEETATQIIYKWTFVEFTEEELRSKYCNLTNQFIREKYSSNDENKIIREYLAYGEEYKPAFDEYNTYVEECKAKAHTEIYGE
jgi:hypothetical protein